MNHLVYYHDSSRPHIVQAPTDGVQQLPAVRVFGMDGGLQEEPDSGHRATDNLRRRNEKPLHTKLEIQNPRYRRPVYLKWGKLTRDPSS